ncbi:hypothetical protein [Nocardiopsis prasina]|uniref:hypothetical protein n=1 Tax=Nocardiopsis prasina TaxID=2015 RepID=UPI000345C76E|nr:hypothetical protein [Nocardiopsis prasina]
MTPTPRTWAWPRVPAPDAALETVAAQDSAAFHRAGEGALPTPAIPGAEAAWSPFSQASADHFGGGDPAEALAEAERLILEAPAERNTDPE